MMVGTLVGATLGALSAGVLALWGDPGPYGLAIVVGPIIGGLIGGILGRGLGQADLLKTIGLGLLAGVLVIPVGGLVAAAGWLGGAVAAGAIGIPDLLVSFLGSTLNPMLSIVLGDPDPAVFLLPPTGLLWSFFSYRLIHGANPPAPLWLAA
jgi:hypothetical protein